LDDDIDEDAAAAAAAVAVIIGRNNVLFATVVKNSGMALTTFRFNCRFLPSLAFAFIYLPFLYSASNKFNSIQFNSIEYSDFPPGHH